MEDLSIQVLGVKEWFSNKNGFVAYRVNQILEVREKAVKLTMTSCGRTYAYWCPKSCLEVKEDVSACPEKYPNLNGMTMDEIIDLYKTTVSFDELVRLNKEDFNDYC